MTSSNYERDFYAWSREQAELLRARRYSELDASHPLEELESMGARERRELVNRLKILLAYPLKWQYQSPRRSRSWAATIKEQRLSIQDLLDDNPSARHAGSTDYQGLPSGTPGGRQRGRPRRSRVSEACPFSWDEISDKGYLP